MNDRKMKEKKENIIEIIKVNSKTIGCDGGTDFGHPLVYLNLEKGEIVCPYCSKKYILRTKK